MVHRPVQRTGEPSDRVRAHKSVCTANLNRVRESVEKARPYIENPWDFTEMEPEEAKEQISAALSEVQLLQEEIGRRVDRAKDSATKIRFLLEESDLERFHVPLRTYLYEKQVEPILQETQSRVILELD